MFSNNTIVMATLVTSVEDMEKKKLCVLRLRILSGIVIMENSMESSRNQNRATYGPASTLLDIYSKKIKVNIEDVFSFSHSL